MAKKTYDKIFITNLPSFYKLNLYNAISEHIKILVIFTGHSSDGRNADFYSGEKKFDYMNLGGLSKIKQCLKLFKILRTTKFREIIVGGWDHPTAWLTFFTTSKKKNSSVVESSYYESSTGGLKGLIKKIFVSRTSRAYVSGKSQKQIFDNLNYKGECIITKGVGVFNYVLQPPYIPRKEVKKFLYVGRLAEVKNLKLLISTFNEFPFLELYITGFGEQEKELKAMANGNIHFLGAVDNKKLPPVYQSMDVFVLPSKSEPWGLVVEEALNNGLPVIVSDRVGCAEEIVNDSNGLIFRHDSPESLKTALKKVLNVSFYNNLRANIALMDFEKIESEQVHKYI